MDGVIIDRKHVAIGILNRCTIIYHEIWDRVSHLVILRMCDHESYKFEVIPLVEFDILS